MQVGWLQWVVSVCIYLRDWGGIAPPTLLLVGGSCPPCPPFGAAPVVDHQLEHPIAVDFPQVRTSATPAWLSKWV